MLITFPFQQREGFCGPACLKIVLGYYGTKVSERKLGRMMRCKSDEGVKSDMIVKTAKKLGFEAFIKDKSTLGDLAIYVRKKNIPVIVEWFYVDEPHYSVVSEFDKENIYLIDPLDGIPKALRHKQFEKLWFGFEGFSHLSSHRQLTIRRMIVIHPKDEHYIAPIVTDK